MIEKWHERTNGPVFKVIFALVSLSFVLGGIGGGLIGADTSAVKVNGEEISQQTFNDAKNRQQNLLNQQMGAAFWDLLDKPEYAAEFNRSIINSLVNDELLRQYANQLNLDISAGQIKAEIVNDPTFHQNGKFDNNLYLQSLRNGGLSTDGYAAIVGQAMRLAQLEEGLVNSNFVVPAQQEQLAKLLFQKREVRLAVASLANAIQNQSVSEEELKAYYEKHKAGLKTAEKLTVEYVTLSPKDVANRVQVTDDQIQTYYDKNRDQYVTKGEVKVAHIQLANEADAKAVEQALQNGADFATLAKEKSLDKLSANQGGDLGWAKAGMFPKAFEDTANALQAGQVSQPVNVDGAYHIIKVLERKPESVIPVEQVKAQIADTIRSELLASEYSVVTNQMANSSFENSGTLENVAKVAGVAVQKTEAFTRDNVPTALQNDAVLKVLFDGDLRQTNQNSEALEVGDQQNPRTMFVRVSNYEAEREKSFDEAKAEVEAMVKREKAETALLAAAEENVKALNEGKANVTFAEPQTLVYAEAIATQPVLSQTVFSMAKPADKATYQVARNDKGDVIIVALEKVTDGNVSEFKPLAAQFDQAERVGLRNDLIKDLRERASIELNEQFIEQLDTPTSH